MVYWGPMFDAYRDGKVHVQSTRCATCIFHPGNLMNLEPGRVKQMVAEACRRDSAIICHDTLEGPAAVCRGFFDAHAKNSAALRLAVALNVVQAV